MFLAKKQKKKRKHAHVCFKSDYSLAAQIKAVQTFSITPVGGVTSRAEPISNRAAAPHCHEPFFTAGTRNPRPCRKKRPLAAVGGTWVRRRAGLAAIRAGSAEAIAQAAGTVCARWPLPCHSIRLCHRLRNGKASARHGGSRSPDKVVAVAIVSNSPTSQSVGENGENPRRRRSEARPGQVLAALCCPVPSPLRAPRIHQSERSHRIKSHAGQASPRTKRSISQGTKASRRQRVFLRVETERDLTAGLLFIECCAALRSRSPPQPPPGQTEAAKAGRRHHTP